jgi:hypothetical protein
MKDESIAQDLDAVLEVLERDGWCQGAILNRWGNKCLLGAMIAMNFSEPHMADLCHALGLNRYTSTASLPSSVSGDVLGRMSVALWNDRVSIDFSDVRTLLKTKADEYR